MGTYQVYPIYNLEERSVKGRSSIFIVRLMKRVHLVRPHVPSLFPINITSRISQNDS